MLRRLTNSIRYCKRTLLLAREFAADYVRYVRHSSAVVRGDTRQKLRALLTISYHGIEKALSLRDPRPGFGSGRVAELLRVARQYVNTYGCDETAVAAVDALRAYVEYNRQAACDVTNVAGAVAELARSIALSVNRAPTHGGSRVIERSVVVSSASLDFQRFAESRYSVRDFAATPVAMSVIEGAVRAAQKSPSVCNRQPGGVVVLTEKRDILAALKIQGGAAGFEEQIDKLLVVTSDLSCFQSSGERNECWIDGGLFAMSLIFGLHAAGVGTCCLNWSKDSAVDRQLRQLLGLNERNAIVLLVGVGSLPERFRVALSERRPLSEALSVFRAEHRAETEAPDLDEQSAQCPATNGRVRTADPVAVRH